MLLPVLAFVFGTLLIGAVALSIAGGPAVTIDRRLEEITGLRERAADGKPRFQSALGFLKRVGDKAPRSSKELGKLRTRLVQAGFRRDEALPAFFGIRIFFALAAFATFSTSLVGRPNLMYALSAFGLG